MLELFQNAGTFFVYLGIACAVIFPGMGSAKGVGIVGEAMSGVLIDDPNKFGQLLILQALPATQGIYGFVVGFFVMISTGILGGTIGTMALGDGLYVFVSCLPIAAVGYFSAIKQGRVSAAGVSLVAKRPEEVSKAMVAAAMVETYAILALLISLLLIIFM